MATLILCGYWGYHQAQGWLSLGLAIGIPVLLSAIWGSFAVPGDPSRSGKTVVKTPGLVRLIIELAFFGFGSFCLADLGHRTWGWGFGAIVVLHYLVSFERVKWLLGRPE